jgi:hypothetical protein
LRSITILRSMDPRCFLGRSSISCCGVCLPAPRSCHD